MMSFEIGGRMHDWVILDDPILLKRRSKFRHFRPKPKINRPKRRAARKAQRVARRANRK